MAWNDGEIRECGREGATVIGVRFVICGNTETLARRLGHGSEDPSGNGWEEAAREAFRAGVTAIEANGFDWGQETRYAAYHGGPRRGLVEAIYYEAHAEDVDEGVPEWCRSESQTICVDRVQATEQQALDAMEVAMVAAQTEAGRRLEHRRTNADDWVLLIEGGKVIGAWATTRDDETWHNYQHPGDLANWEATHPDATDPKDYGELVEP